MKTNVVFKDSGPKKLTVKDMGIGDVAYTEDNEFLIMKTRYNLEEYVLWLYFGYMEKARYCDFELDCILSLGDKVELEVE